MNFPFLKFNNWFAFRGAKKHTLRLSHEDILFWGSVFILVLFLALVLVDGYMFYQSVTLQRKVTYALEYKPKTILSQDLDEVIKLLDERQKKFEEILKTK